MVVRSSDEQEQKQQQHLALIVHPNFYAEHSEERVALIPARERVAHVDALVSCIFSFMDASTVLVCSEVSMAWHKRANCVKLWVRLCKCRWGWLPDSPEKSREFYEKMWESFRVVARQATTTLMGMQTAHVSTLLVPTHPVVTPVQI